MSWTNEGAYRIVPIDNLDASDEVKAQFKREVVNNKEGVKRAPKGTIPSISKLLALLPTAKRSHAVLRQRLPSRPTSLHGTLLADAEVIGKEPRMASSRTA